MTNILTESQKNVAFRNSVLPLITSRAQAYNNVQAKALKQKRDELVALKQNGALSDQEQLAKMAQVAAEMTDIINMKIDSLSYNPLELMPQNLQQHVEIKPVLQATSITSKTDSILNKSAVQAQKVAQIGQMAAQFQQNQREFKGLLEAKIAEITDQKNKIKAKETQLNGLVTAINASATAKLEKQHIETAINLLLELIQRINGENEADYNAQIQEIQIVAGQREADTIQMLENLQPIFMTLFNQIDEQTRVRLENLLTKIRDVMYGLAALVYE